MKNKHIEHIKHITLSNGRTKNGGFSIYGPSGCGKTLAMIKLCNMTGGTFFTGEDTSPEDLANLLGLTTGDVRKLRPGIVENIKDLIDLCKSMSPADSIIYIDSAQLCCINPRSIEDYEVPKNVVISFTIRN